MISLNWGGHKKIAVGYSYGRVTVWNMEAALEGDDQKDENQCRRYLTHSVNVLDAAARVVQWNGHDDPNILLLGGYDGRILLVDLKDPHLPYVMTRIRGKLKYRGSDYVTI
jgi:hypothetical protein